MHSMTFDRIGCTDIDLYLSIEDLSPDSYIGVTFTIISFEGKSELSIQRFVSSLKGAAISSAPSTIMHAKITPWPGAFFRLIILRTNLALFLFVYLI